MGFLQIPTKQFIWLSLGTSMFLFPTIPAMHTSTSESSKFSKFLQHGKEYAEPIPREVVDMWEDMLTSQGHDNNLIEDSCSAMPVHPEPAPEIRNPAHDIATTFRASTSRDNHLLTDEGHSMILYDSHPIQRPAASASLPSGELTESGQIDDSFVKRHHRDFVTMIRHVYRLAEGYAAKWTHPTHPIVIFLTKEGDQVIKMKDPDETNAPGLHELSIGYRKLIISMYRLQMKKFGQLETGTQDHKLHFDGLFRWLHEQIFSPEEGLPILGVPNSEFQLTEDQFSPSVLGEAQVKLSQYFLDKMNVNDLATGLISDYYTMVTR
ncbi:hypothetical protein Pst134EB_025166 [Puccinia striiformis f. sp. tritici]|uniref:Uncharacterized protein n=1 Tax=Puccinia striiformis f. sp. tritici PST-78 TaxID=1165861 RepID=A0A0L0VHS2_9BASI|nr:hypothetical protein Pst134EB_025166 [Puccinia striiformis f. sp. tritici]KNE98808.1 hypothetical protein PSTG_07995 [Puccinia striiformis f. sp. tritici PST-78]